jgi:NADH dehydrogenase
MSPARPHIVIVGGGFGGLYTAQFLKRAPVDVTLVDRRNFHLFQPLLYQVATGGLSPGDIASPVRWVLRHQQNARVLLAEVVDLDVDSRRVILSDGVIGYDTLVVAAGVTHHYFGHDEWAEWAPGLKTIEDATHIRRRVLTAFEAAEREPDLQRRRTWLTFAVVGGGPTGVELAGALGELANDTLKGDFRTIDPTEARILLIEGADRVLPTYPADLSERAARSLGRLGATVRLNTLVTEIDEEGITVTTDGVAERIPSRCVLWAAGVRASSLGRALAHRGGAKLDGAGRVIVERDLTIGSHPEVFVIGDLASYSHQGSRALPGVAPVAMQQGRYVARLIRRRLTGKDLPAFRYVDRGTLATIGRAAAVADFGRLRFSGFAAWFLWLAVHLTFLIEFENRLLVLIQWAWNYFTRNRGTRLIVGERGASTKPRSGAPLP